MSSARRFGVEARRRCAAALPSTGRRDERLDLDEQRPAALERGRDGAPPGAGRGLATPRKAPAGSATSRRPAPVISRTPTSSVEPKRFLLRAQEAQRAVALALERQHDVDEVLERLGAGQAAVLGDVADEDDRRRRARGRTPPAAPPTRAPGRPSPAGPSSPSSVSVWIESTTSSAGSQPVGGLDDALDVGLGEHVRRASPAAPVGQAEARGAQAGAGRPTPRPTRTARVPAPSSGSRAMPAAALEHERRLADARLAAEQDERAGHEAAAEDAVDLADARRAPSDGLGARAARSGARTDWRWRSAARALGRAAVAGADDGLDERVPGAAGAALALPAQASSRRRPGRRSGSPAAPRARRPRPASSPRAARWSARRLGAVDDDRSARPGSDRPGAPRRAGPRPCSG